MSWWQHIPESINPDIIDIGFFQVRYYSLMYIIAFASTYWLVLYQIKKHKYDFSRETIQEYFLCAILGVMIGGRLGYVFFYRGILLTQPGTRYSCHSKVMERSKTLEYLEK